MLTKQSKVMHFSLYSVLVWAKGHTLKYSHIEISPNNDQVINPSSISLQGFKTEALTVVISLWAVVADICTDTRTSHRQ